MLGDVQEPDGSTNIDEGEARMTHTASTSAETVAGAEAAAPPPLGAIHHLSLTVTDLDASLAWYQRLFGLMKIMDEEHAGGRAVVLMHPSGQLFLGLHSHEANAGECFAETRTGLDHVSIAVPSRADLERWERRLVELGVTYSPIYERAYGALLVFRDPDNIQLELIAATPQS